MGPLPRAHGGDQLELR
uniref:Uncharacterized protein n=1 Tax=Arundo donax TaxID=35708 RepID=A0A0A9A164_ARUDO